MADEQEAILYVPKNQKGLKHEGESEGTFLTTQDVIDFISKNIVNMKNIGCYDLNDTINKQQGLEELNFQDIKKIDIFPKAIEEVLNPKSTHYCHSGVLKYITKGNKTNISFYSSVLTCLKQNFISQTTSFQFNFLTRFIDILLSEIHTTKFEQFGFRNFNLSKTDLHNFIERGKINEYVIKFVSDFLYVNIFILNVNDDKIDFFNNTFIPYKKNIFIIQYTESDFEPLFTEYTKIFSITTPLIQKIINDKSSVCQYDFTDESFSNISVNYVEPKVSVAPPPETTEKKEYEKVDQNYKRDELLKIASELNIELKNGKKYKTKTELINEINRNLFKAK
jgi:hypothetical protein